MSGIILFHESKSKLLNNGACAICVKCQCLYEGASSEFVKKKNPFHITGKLFFSCGKQTSTSHLGTYIRPDKVKIIAYYIFSTLLKQDNSGWATA